jgi:Thiamine pyrophosphate enzyme, C-terminal TPP binding domain
MMNVKDACEVIAAARKAVCPTAPIVDTMSAMHTLDDMGVMDNRLDCVPLMGGASCLGLGISLMKPDTTVIVIDGDASLLMELGSLVTIANAKPKRFVHILMHNNTQFSGIVNLPTAAAEPDCDFAAMAKAAGYQDVRLFDNAEALAAALPQILTQSGATFVDLKLKPTPNRIDADRPQPILPDMQFQRMRMGAAKLRETLAA